MARAKIGPKHPSQFVRKSGKTAGKAISREARKKFATLVEKQPGPRGGRTFYRFPIPPGDEAAARNALARIPVAKGLSAEEKRKIARQAVSTLGHMTPAAAKILGVKGGLEEAKHKAMRRLTRR